MLHEPAPRAASDRRRAQSWTTHPAAERVVAAVCEEAYARCPPARAFAERLLAETGVRLRDLLDHLHVGPSRRSELEAAGWVEGADGLLVHHDGYFPDVTVADDDEAMVAFRCESVERFLAAQGLDARIEGAAFGPYRRATVFQGEGARFVAAERNGHVGHDVPVVSPALIRQARLHMQSFRARRRQFDTVAQGLDHTEDLVEAAVADIGPHWACDLFVRADREYWMGLCDAGRLQKSLQDAMGIGWANVDHHTYDSSREHFAQTIRILERLGYECRELFYAGADAGWGSQILEQPALRSTIFADIDLSPDELDIDFAHMDLAPLPRQRRTGLWCAMHGESILEGGLNHVAGMFDQRGLRRLANERGVSMMRPFSDMPHLYQELTEGQWRPVQPRRIDALEQSGALGQAEAEDFRLNGAIATHLENLERNDGYKGFNQPGIDGVLRVIDPRRNMVERAPGAMAALKS